MYEFHLDLCDKVIAKQSPDPSLQVGACILDGMEITATGYNRFEDGVPVTYVRLQRPLKYKLIRHAEIMALNNASETHNRTLVCNWMPCDACTTKIIQAGISKVVVRNFATLDRWKEAHYKSKQMLEDAGIQLVIE